MTIQSFMAWKILKARLQLPVYLPCKSPMLDAVSLGREHYLKESIILLLSGLPLTTYIFHSIAVWVFFRISPHPDPNTSKTDSFVLC